MWIIQQLNNIDKHRIVQPMLLHRGDFKAPFKPLRDIPPSAEQFIFDVNHSPLEHEEPFLVVTSPHAQIEVDDELHMTVYVKMDTPGGPAEIVPALAALSDSVDAVLTEFERFFP